MSNDVAIPRAPPLPASKSFQRARDAANRIFGYASRPPSPQDERPIQPSLEGRRRSGRLATLGASQNATASHKTGLEIKTLSINESGTHALLGGKDIFKTIRVENGVCVEEINLRAAIRSNPTQASGKPRQIYNIDIADVAWAKGDTGEFVAAATESGKIIIYDLGHAGLPAAQLHEHYRQVHRITCNPHKGSLLLSGSQDGTVRLWDVRDAKQPVGATKTRSNVQSKSKFAGTTDGVRDVKWSPTDAMDFAFATDSGSVQVWDMRYFNRPKVKIIAHSSTCMSVDWHPDGKHLASTGLDHMIKVWDTSVKSGRKGNWEIKTPYPLSNARWRPACEVGSVNDDDNTMRQCTQLLAAYDRSHPELHVWDLRRPTLPFRELAPYSEAPTDLLWHSQDLLWTVGRDGTFVQNDIQHSSIKVMDRCPVNASAISPTGEIASFNMRRKIRPILRHRRASSSHAPDSTLLSRSWADDSLDDSFLRAHPEIVKQQQRRRHSRQSSDVGVPIYPARTRVISLDQVFSQRRAVRPVQTAWRGQLPPAYCTDPLVFEYMAQQACLTWQQGSNESENLSNVDHIMAPLEAFTLDRAALTDPRNSVSLVTGGSAGIGLQTALLLHDISPDNRIIILDRQPPHPQQAPKSFINSPRVFYQSCDITSWSSQRAAFAAGAEKFGRIDNVFVNAGIAEHGEQFFGEELDGSGQLKEPDRRTYDVDLYAASDTVKLAIYWLRKNGKDGKGKKGGRIVMTASLAGYLASAGAPMYSAAKHGILGLLRSLKNDTATLSIALSIVAPGITLTDIVSGRDPGETLNAWAIRMRKLGVPINDPGEIATAVVWLMSLGMKGNGKGLLVQAGRCADVEEGLAKGRKEWMGEEMLGLFRGGRNAPLFPNKL
nr:hypothetical protein B0A51_08573 [Rachicladosporium sp. CCFEE 5018]